MYMRSPKFRVSNSSQVCLHLHLLQWVKLNHLKVASQGQRVYISLMFIANPIHHDDSMINR